MKRNSPSKKALGKARKLAREAAKVDNWMTPCPEENLEEGTAMDQIIQSHREGWQETCHWDHYYGRPLREIAIEDARSDAFDDYYESHFIPLIDAFWEVWEDKTKFYEKAREAVDAAKRTSR